MKSENKPSDVEMTSEMVKLEDDEMEMVSGGNGYCEPNDDGAIQTSLDPLDPMEHAKEAKGGLKRAIAGKHPVIRQVDNNSSMF